MSRAWNAWRELRRHPALRAARRLIVTVVGGTVLLSGVALLVLPGPAFLVIPLGLGILATEFVWARRLLENVRDRIRPSAAAQEGAATPAEAPRGVHALVMAGSRGTESAFLRATGAVHRALVEVDGRPLLAHVLNALDGCERVVSIHASIDVAGETHAKEALEGEKVATPLEWLRSDSSPARSVLAALASDTPYPLLVTTADHALLTPEILDDFLSRCEDGDGDVVVGLVPSEIVLGRYPDTPRTVLRFAGEGLCGSNLFLFRRPAARNAVAFWVRVEADRKRPLRMLRHFGLWPALRFALRRLPLRSAVAIAARRFDCSVQAVRLASPEAAIDVDSMADRALAETILRRRREAQLETRQRSSTDTTRSSLS